MMHNKTLSQCLPQPARIKDYLLVMKPGIVLGNLITVAGGVLLASRGNVLWSVLWAAMAGVACVVASGCVLNNCIDRDIDSHMERTRKRAIASGRIAPWTAFIYAAVLVLIGLSALYAFTTPAATFGAGAGLFIYVCAYSLYFKRHSVHGTVIGSFSGAMPPVIGYCAVSGQVDAAALTLFAMFSLWQMPHSYAIAIFRQGDYERAQLPVVPLVNGVRNAKWQIVIYIALFSFAASMLTLLGYTGKGYLAAVFTVALAWLYRAVKGFSAQDDKAWARGVFGQSILVVLVISIMMSVDWVA